MAAPIQIRRKDVVENIRRLARMKGLSITDTVGQAVKSALEEHDVAWQAEINAIVDHFNALPKIGPRLTDDDLYDEDGLPK